MKVTKYNKYAGLFILTLVFCLSIQAQSGLPAKDIEAVRAVEETYRAAWLKNDEKTILSLFADDAALYQFHDVTDRIWYDTRSAR